MRHTAYCRANAAGSGNSVCTCVMQRLPAQHKEQCACKRCLGVRRIYGLIVGLALTALIDVALATLIYGVAVAWMMR